MRSLKVIFLSSTLMLLKTASASANLSNIDSRAEEGIKTQASNNESQQALAVLKDSGNLSERISNIEKSHNVFILLIINKVNELFDGWKEIISDTTLSERMTSLSVERVPNPNNGEELSAMAQDRLRALTDVINNVKANDSLSAENAQKITSLTDEVAQLTTQLNKDISTHLDTCQKSENAARLKINEACDNFLKLFKIGADKLNQINFAKSSKIQLQHRSAEISEERKKLTSDLEKMKTFAIKLKAYNNSADVLQEEIDQNVDDVRNTKN